jgi:hypothetical protein
VYSGCTWRTCRPGTVQVCMLCLASWRGYVRTCSGIAERHCGDSARVRRLFPGVVVFDGEPGGGGFLARVSCAWRQDKGNGTAGGSRRSRVASVSTQHVRRDAARAAERGWPDARAARVAEPVMEPGALKRRRRLRLALLLVSSTRESLFAT